MKNKTYDILKLILLVPTPLVTCISALSEIFNWAPGAKIAAAVGAIATCLGFYLLDSSKKYEEAKKQEEMQKNIEEQIE